MGYSGGGEGLLLGLPVSKAFWVLPFTLFSFKIRGKAKLRERVGPHGKEKKIQPRRRCNPEQPSNTTILGDLSAKDFATNGLLPAKVCLGILEIVC